MESRDGPVDRLQVVVHRLDVSGAPEVRLSAGAVGPIPYDVRPSDGLDFSFLGFLNFIFEAVPDQQ